jgi:SM-20-related protein
LPYYGSRGSYSGAPTRGQTEKFGLFCFGYGPSGKNVLPYTVIWFYAILDLNNAVLLPIFNNLIDSFVEDRVGISENFLNTTLAAQLKENLLALYANDAMHLAGIGNDAVQAHDQLIRSDKIYWLDRAHNNAQENNFFDLMDRFVAFLNSTCYTGITGYEFHYALYEKGSFYKRHLDQFKQDRSRAYSMIIYLNTDWQESDGGQLCIYHADHIQTIAPLNGKCAFFKSSELEHEVLVTHQPRLSITGWLKT